MATTNNLQHPLCYTLALCNALFLNNPYIIELINQSTPANLKPNTAISGIMFLLAHEMVGIINSYLLPLNSERILELAISLAIYFQGQNISEDLMSRSIKALSDLKLQEISKHPLMKPCLTVVLEENQEKQQELFSSLPMNDEFIVKFFSSVSNMAEFIKIANNEDMYKALLLKDTFESFKNVY